MATIAEQEWIGVADQARLVRKAIKAAFPGVKFSVRSSSYAGGASIDVRWTDGPTTDQVNPVVKQFEGGGFDGMIDMAYSWSSWLMPDGSACVADDPGTTGSMGCNSPEHNDKPHPDARPVKFHADSVFTDRTVTGGLESSEVFVNRVAHDLCELQRVDYAGPCTRYLLGGMDRDSLQDHVYRLGSQTEFKPGETYAGVKHAEPDNPNVRAWAEIVKVVPHA